MVSDLHLLPLLISRGLLSGAKGLLYSAYVRCFMIYRSKKWSVRKYEVTRIQKNDARTAIMGQLDLRAGFSCSCLHMYSK